VTQPWAGRTSVLPDLRQVSVAARVRPAGAFVVGAMLALLGAFAAATATAATATGATPGTLARVGAAVIGGLAPALCWTRGSRADEAERPAWGWLALALTLMSLGGTLKTQYASAGTAVAMLGAPCLWLALCSLARLTTAGAVPISRRLDGLIAGTGTAALLALPLAPALTTAGERLPAVLRLLGAVYSLALAGLAVGLATVRGWRLSPTSWLLLAGTALVLGSDVLRLTMPLGTGDLARFTALLAWPVAATVLALVAGRPAGQAEPGSTATTGQVAVPVVVAWIALAMIVAGAGGVARVLAVLTVGGVTARLVWTLREVRDLFANREQARTDDLTGLANRRAFHERGALLVAECWTTPLALLLLDLDRFKDINDSLGHSSGDRLLQVAADRLAAAVPEGGVLARLGGDEFALLLPDADVTRALRVAETVAATVAVPVSVDGLSLRTAASIGVSLAPAHGRDVAELLRCADIAMYDAKAAHAGPRVYDPRADIHGEGRLRLLDELRAGIARGELELRYQPKLTLADSVVHSVEALVRWQHPKRGLLGPGEFLPLAEAGGLMPAVTDAVLEMAVTQARVWQGQGRPLAVAVNLTTSVLLDVALPERLMSVLREAELPPSLLHVEVTEELLMTDRERTRNTLARIRAQGIRVAIDDFGTGYSSLSYLRQLPVDDLKLDLSFVTPMAVDPRAAALVASTIELAHSLDLRLIAEGVETDQILQLLRHVGCDEAQGYFIGRPLPGSEVLTHLRGMPRPPALVGR